MSVLISEPSWEALKAGQRATWEAGDFGRIARYSEPSAEEFMARVPLRAGAAVLDVACGTGNLALIAARRGCAVTGVDIAANLIEQACARGETERLSARFDHGDAEALPYPDARFDVVVSMFGVMFAPRPERAVSELLRVCRPGGTIALANWTPEGFVGRLFETVGRHVPPAAGLPSPVLWGNEAVVRDRFGPGVTHLALERRIAHICYPYPVPQTVEFFRQFFGPTQRAFSALDVSGQAALRADLEALYRTQNPASATTTFMRGEYLEVQATRA